MKISRRTFLSTATGFILTATTAAAKENVRIAVAANFKPTLDALASQFTKTHGHGVAISTGSTGKLYAQIIRGAPFDIFLAADQARPTLLTEARHAVPSSQRSYAEGQLALWAPGRNVGGPDILTADRIKHIAIAAPDLAPYGLAAQESLSALGLADAVEDRLVLGENIGQTFTFVRTGNAQAGLVALSQLMASSVPETEYWPIPADMHPPILQDGVLLSGAEANPTAIAFMDFLQSETARAIIASNGYRVP